MTMAKIELRSHPAALDNDWFTALFRASGLLTGGRVTDVGYCAVGAGMMGDSIRFELQYDEPDDAPASIIGKFPSTNPTSRATCVDFGLYLTEVRFYQEVVDAVSIRTPSCYHADIDVGTGDFLVMLEDMTPARGGNQLTGCSLADAEQAMIQAAALHGPRWCDPAIRRIPWLQDRPRILKAIRATIPACLAEFHHRYDGILEPEYMAVCDRFGAVAGEYYAMDYEIATLTHYDYRLDNMLFDAKGGTAPLVVLDWQSIAVSSGALDVSYFLGAALSVETRRMHERRLIELYLDELKRYGVKDFGFDALWHDYRVTVLQGVATAIFASASTKRTERGDAMFLTMARGACSQAIEADAFAALAAR